KGPGDDRLARHPSTPQYLTLVKGDLLYVPRGMYHSAQALSGPSLHITIGIPCRTHIDFAHWMIDQLAHLPEMRKNLPRHWLESSMEYRDSDLQDHAIKILDALREMIEAGDLGSRFDKEVSARKAPVSSMRFPL
ncbi:MAG: cupin domain-containing protein, partial [Saprospiraceae bacterium]|nr:cupin domain-containing protein [Saprospiraceae bacterium]